VLRMLEESDRSGVGEECGRRYTGLAGVSH
jgi:hypothetical protein